jgi:hypothetical protein
MTTSDFVSLPVGEVGDPPSFASFAENVTYKTICRRVSKSISALSLAGFVIAMAFGMPASSQTLNGFGLPQTVEHALGPTSHSAHLQRERGIEARYIDRVKAVGKFLRKRYGFGFGDSKATVESNNLLEADIILAAAYSTHERISDPDWSVKGNNTVSLAVAFAANSDTKLVTLFVSYDRSTPARLSQEENEIEALLANSGLSRTLDVRQQQWLYNDPRDPCHLEVGIPESAIPTTSDNLGFSKWIFYLAGPSRECLDNIG